MFGNGGVANGLLAITALLLAVASMVAAVAVALGSERAWPRWLVGLTVALPVWFVIAYAKEHP